jgi:hypothetical protein
MAASSSVAAAAYASNSRRQKIGRSLALKIKQGRDDGRIQRGAGFCFAPARDGRSGLDRGF